jgi:bacillithiol biosynthesis cysteine-adding enzyme BshC
MDTFQLDLDKSGCCSSLIEDYNNNKETATQFVKYPFAFEQFEQVIRDKAGSYKMDRALLAKVIHEQYQHHETSQAVKDNIELLRQANTFTITTAHQPLLFTGPLFFIYKIMGAINTAAMLREQYPDSHFVPVFWMGSEDHDFEEINHTYVYGNPVYWQRDGNGAVGRMSTEGIDHSISDLEDILKNRDGGADEILELFKEAYNKFERFDQATHYLVDRLFSRFGLVIIIGDDARLKDRYKDIMEDEILNQRVQQVTESTLAKMEDHYKVQANPRDINVFYLTEDNRGRLVMNDDGSIQTADETCTFSQHQLKEEIEAYPERFSPNVMLRPLYQDTLLPNLAYVGGGGELSYWMEQRPVFEHYGVNYPMLILRNSVLWLDKGSRKKLNKFWLKEEDLFRDEDQLINSYIEKHARDEISLSEEKKELEELYNRILSRAEGIDVTLKKTVLGEQQKQLKALDKLEGKLLKAEKNKHDEAVNQLRHLKQKLFPKGELQERVENFLSQYIIHGDAFFTILHEQLDPFQKSFLIIKK